MPEKGYKEMKLYAGAEAIKLPTAFETNGDVPEERGHEPLGEAMRTARDKTGFTQKSLSTRLGIRPIEYIAYVKNIVIPAASMKQRIFELLGMG